MPDSPPQVIHMPLGELLDPDLAFDDPDCAGENPVAYVHKPVADHLVRILDAVLYTDERGQGVGFDEAMAAAVKALAAYREATG